MVYNGAPQQDVYIKLEHIFKPEDVYPGTHFTNAFAAITRALIYKQKHLHHESVLNA